MHVEKLLIIGGCLLAYGAAFVNTALLIHTGTDTLPELSIASASIGCGLQNAIANHYRGIVLRTTHLTGMFTDFGVTMGMRLRGHHIPVWKIVVPLSIIIAFFAGGISAAILHLQNQNIVAIASLAYLGSGLAWSIIKRKALSENSIQPS